MTAKLPKYIFGGIPFSSQDAVRKHARGIRDKYLRGVRIADSADILFLMDLIEGHLERDSKVGPGVDYFYWASSPDHPADCFYLVRVDGSETDFGIPSCLRGAGAIARINRQSLRMAIQQDIKAFKESRLGGADNFKSDYSGKTFPSSEAVVDHHVPFEVILTQFFDPKRIDLAAALLTRSKDMSSDPEWCDRGLIGEFIEFHRGFPLRLVQWRENLSEINKENNLGRIVDPLS